MTSREECCGWASWGALAGIDDRRTAGDGWLAAERSAAVAVESGHAADRILDFTTGCHPLLAAAHGSPNRAPTIAEPPRRRRRLTLATLARRRRILGERRPPTARPDIP